MLDLKPDAGLEGTTLDYTQPDDQLVGIAAACVGSHPEVDVVVRPHDAGPAAGAKAARLDRRCRPRTWDRAPALIASVEIAGRGSFDNFATSRENNATDSARQLPRKPVAPKRRALSLFGMPNKFALPLEVFQQTSGGSSIDGGMPPAR